MPLKLLYFAWVREKVGRAEEMIELPAGVETAGELIAWLRTRGDEYERAFERTGAIRVAADRIHIPQSADVRRAREIAFFPPVTGG